MHDHDLIPHLPEQNELLLLKYQHAPREILFGKNMTLRDYRVCRQVGEDPECSDSYKNFTMAEHAANFYIIQDS